LHSHHPEQGETHKTYDKGDAPFFHTDTNLF
jgi:hypothetical protein